jgi:hypothetical protein
MRIERKAPGSHGAPNCARSRLGTVWRICCTRAAKFGISAFVGVSLTF